MRFFADRPDLLTPVRWYFVPADRPTLEIPTVFASKTFEVANREELPLIGEVAARTWNRGNAPHTFDGQHYCGTDQQWLGCLSTDVVDPNCCGVEAPPDATCDLRIGLRLGCTVQTFDGGGVVLDGSGEGRGGVVLDGSGEGRGGVVLDGSGEGRGGVVIGGSGVPTNTPVLDCGFCLAGTWSLWNVTLSGGTGTFASWNGTWTIGPGGGPGCTWYRDVFPLPQPDALSIRFTVQSGFTQVELINLVNNTVFRVSPRVCTGSATLTYFTGPTGTRPNMVSINPT